MNLTYDVVGFHGITWGVQKTDFSRDAKFLGDEKYPNKHILKQNRVGHVS